MFVRAGRSSCAQCTKRVPSCAWSFSSASKTPVQARNSKKIADSFTSVPLCFASAERKRVVTKSCVVSKLCNIALECKLTDCTAQKACSKAHTQLLLRLFSSALTGKIHPAYYGKAFLCLLVSVVCSPKLDGRFSNVSKQWTQACLIRCTVSCNCCIGRSF